MHTTGVVAVVVVYHGEQRDRHVRGGMGPAPAPPAPPVAAAPASTEDKSGSSPTQQNGQLSHKQPASCTLHSHVRASGMFLNGTHDTHQRCRGHQPPAEQPPTRRHWTGLPTWWSPPLHHPPPPASPPTPRTSWWRWFAGAQSCQAGGTVGQDAAHTARQTGSTDGVRNVTRHKPIPASPSTPPLHRWYTTQAQRLYGRGLPTCTPACKRTPGRTRGCPTPPDGWGAEAAESRAALAAQAASSPEGSLDTVQQ